MNPDMQMKPPLRILHLEDEASDAELVRRTMEREGLACAITLANSRAEFTAALESEKFDLVLSDFAMPGFNGLSALAILRKKFPAVPFILLSGTLGEERAIESLKSGATDYVLKERLGRLVPAVRRAMLEVEQTAGLQRAEAERRVYGHKLQALSRRLVNAQETERRHIARELHDQVGQALTVAQLNLQAIARLPAAESLNERLNDTLTVLEQVLEQVRSLSLELRPSLLDDLGLVAALRWYTERQAATAGLKIELVADQLERRLDPVIETECFRLVQEALTNVARHARAQQVTVELHEEGGCLHLRVRDDGVGFQVAAIRELAVRGASLGLLGMEERAALAGGELEFKSAPGQGAEVHAWFPLRYQATPA